MDQSQSWFYFKPPPHNFKMLNYLKKKKSVVDLKLQGPSSADPVSYF